MPILNSTPSSCSHSSVSLIAVTPQLLYPVLPEKKRRFCSLRSLSRSGSSKIKKTSLQVITLTVTDGVVVTGIVQSFNELYQRSSNHGAWFNELLITCKLGVTALKETHHVSDSAGLREH